MLPWRRGNARATSVMFLLVFLVLHTARSFVMAPKTTDCNAPARRRSESKLSMITGWTSGISHEADGIKAVKELLKPLEKNAESDGDGIVFMFVNRAHSKSFGNMVQAANEVLPKEKYQLLALVGGGVIGGGIEVDAMESKPSVSILYGDLPAGSTATTFGVESEAKDNKKMPWSSISQDDNSRSPSYILFVDPWASTSEALEEIDAANKDGDDSVVVVGGISCPTGATDPSVAYNNKCLPLGSIVGVKLEGNVGIQTLVAQGCRPVGPTFVVTAAANNVVLELSGLSALEQLEQVVAQEASEQEKAIIQKGGLLGGVIADPSSNNKGDKNQDFLARQIIGFQPRMNEGSGGDGGNKGAIVIATPVSVGDLFRFQVRDTSAAQQDFEIMVQRYKTERLFSLEGHDNKAGLPLAALQISCVARGQSLFGRPNVDLEQTQKLFSGVNSTSSEEGTSATFSQPPVAGFFANGEIGPVGLAGFGTGLGGGSTHVHGFTTVVAMLCDYSNKVKESAESTASVFDSSASGNEEASEAWG